MGKRITGTFKNPHENEFTVDIYDADYSGSVTSVIIMGCKILWESDKPEDIHATIVGSRATIEINIPATDTTLTQFIEDFAYGEDSRFLVEITKDNIPTLVWRGILKADQSGEEDIDPFTFKLSAICGLGSLKDKPYHDGTAIYTGIERFTQHIAKALGKMPHVSTFWTGSDALIQTAVDWWSVSMASGSDDDALYQGGVDHAAFYNYQKEGGIDEDVLSAYDVLSHILRSFNLRIYQSEGMYRIDQIPYRTASPYYTRNYDTTGAFLSSATNSNANVINQTGTGAKLTLINYDYLPILKKAEVTYDVKLRRNFLNGFNLTDGFDTINFNQKISSNSATTIIRLRGTIFFGIENIGYTGGLNDILFFIPNIRLNIGANYLKREYTLTNFTANLKQPEWSTSNTNRVYLPNIIGTAPPLGSTANGQVSFDILTPALPADGDVNQFFFSEGFIYKWNGTQVSGFDITWSASNLVLEVFDEGTPLVSEDQVLYTATNPAEATEVYKTTVRIGSETLPNSAGRAFRWAGGTWQPAQFWGQGVETRDDYLGDLLARNILNAQESARKRMNGSLYGVFRIHRLVQTSDGYKWMFSRVEWDITDDVMNGSWVELNYGTTGVSSTPIKKKVIPNGPTYPPTTDPNNPNGLTNNLPGFNINPAPAVLAPVSYNQLDGEISEGDTVTSIPIKTASAGNEFLAGDFVRLVNPFTGQFQEFEIATEPLSGDVSLSVTSTAAQYWFPEDSYLVIRQNAYAFRKRWKTYEAVIASNAVTIPTSTFFLPTDANNVYAIVRRQTYLPDDGADVRDFSIDYGLNKITFLTSLGLNGQTVYVKAFV